MNMDDGTYKWNISTDFKLLIEYFLIQKNLESGGKNVEFGMLYNKLKNEYKLELPNFNNDSDKINIVMNIIKNIITKHMQNIDKDLPNLYGLHIKINKIDDLSQNKKIKFTINNPDKIFESFGINMILDLQDCKSLSIHDINKPFEQSIEKYTSIISISILFIKEQVIEKCINFNGQYPIELTQYIKDIKIFSNEKHVLSSSPSMDSLPSVGSWPSLHALLPIDIISNVIKLDSGDKTPKLHNLTPEPRTLSPFVF